MASQLTVEQMQAPLGQKVGTSRWYEMTAARIKAFSAVPGDLLYTTDPSVALFASCLFESRITLVH